MPCILENRVFELGESGSEVESLRFRAYDVRSQGSRYLYTADFLPTGVLIMYHNLKP